MRTITKYSGVLDNNGLRGPAVLTDVQVQTRLLSLPLQNVLVVCFTLHSNTTSGAPKSLATGRGGGGGGSLYFSDYCCMYLSDFARGLAAFGLPPRSVQRTKKTSIFILATSSVCCFNLGGASFAFVDEVSRSCSNTGITTPSLLLLPTILIFCESNPKKKHFVRIYTHHTPGGSFGCHYFSLKISPPYIYRYPFERPGIFSFRNKRCTGALGGYIL